MKAGYDADYSELEDLQASNDWFNSDRGLFKTVEFHERRSRKSWSLIDPYTREKMDITKIIKATDSGRYDNDMLQDIRHKYPGGIVKRELLNEVWQTTVVPALNMKLYDKPYKIQNGMFKYIPGFCYDFTHGVFGTRSVIDHLIDPASSYNKRRNSMLEYIMRLSSGETWIEEDALGDHEEAFLLNKIGGLKKVGKDALRL